MGGQWPRVKCKITDGGAGHRQCKSTTHPPTNPHSHLAVRVLWRRLPRKVAASRAV